MVEPSFTVGLPPSFSQFHTYFARLDRKTLNLYYGHTLSRNKKLIGAERKTNKEY